MLTEVQRKHYALQVTIVRALGYAIGMLKGLGVNPESITELEENLNYIVNEFANDGRQK